MFKRIVAMLGLAMLFAGAPALAQTAAESAVSHLQGIVGQEYEGDLVITSVAAEKEILVVTVNARSGWAGLPQDQITNLLLGGFCESPTAAEYFKSGWLRVDTLDHGGDLKHGAPVNSCPTAK